VQRIRSASSRRAAKAATTVGSKCVPLRERIQSIESACDQAFLYGRTVVSAS
jgi:hypothetical protein